MFAPGSTVWWNELIANNNPSAKLSHEELTTESVVKMMCKTLSAPSDSKGDSLRLHLLMFASENCDWFLLDPASMAAAFHTFSSLLQSSEDRDANHLFRGQLLSSLTTIMIQRGVISTQREQFESFVEMLLDCIAAQDDMSDRQLRAVACECLQECELSYPGLLSGVIGRLVSLYQGEKTHSAQSYSSLLATALQGLSARLSVDKSAASVAAAMSALQLAVSSEQEAPEAIGFVVPQQCKLRPMPPFPFFGQTAVQHPPTTGLPDALIKELRRCVAVITDGCTSLTPHALAKVLASLPLTVQLCNMPVELFRNRFFSLLYKHDPLLFHVATLMVFSLPGVFTDSDYRRVIKRLVFISNATAATPLPARVLMLHWLIHIPSIKGVPMSFTSHHRLSPSFFDPIALRTAKLRALLHCFTPGVTDQESGPAPPPSNLIHALVGLADFEYHGPDSPHTSVVFDFLSGVIQRYPVLRQSALLYVTNVLRRRPIFVSSVLGCLDSLKVNAEASFFLLVGLSEALTDPSWTDFAPYLTLVSRMVSHGHPLDPKPLLFAVFRFLRMSPLCKNGDWLLGHEMIQVCKQTLLSHQLEFVFEPLKEILWFMSGYYGDVEIRDRAHFCFKLMTHANNEQLHHVLDGPALKQDIMHAGLLPTLMAGELPVDTHDVSFLSLVRSPSKPWPESLPHAQLEHDFLVDTYLQHLASLEATDALPAVSIPLELKYIDESESAPETIYGVCFTFKASPLYRTIPSLHIPALSRNGPSLTQSYSLQLRFRPLLPVQESVSIDAEFTDASGVTGRVRIAPLLVTLKDLALPAPLPSAVFGDEEDEMKCAAIARQARFAVFDALWSTVLDQHDDKEPGIESVKRVDMDRDDVERAVRRHLGPHLVGTGMNALLFLPPQFHILLSFEIHPKHTVIHIRSDLWHAIGHIEELIDEILNPGL